MVREAWFPLADICGLTIRVKDAYRSEGTELLPQGGEEGADGHERGPGVKYSRANSVVKAMPLRVFSAKPFLTRPLKSAAPSPVLWPPPLWRELTFSPI